MNKASFLDPRFKSSGFLSEEERKTTQSAILQEAIAVNVSELHMDEPQPKRSRGENKLMELLRDIVDCQQETDTGGDQQAEKEIHKYIQCMYISEDPVSESPLLWWQDNKAKYPILSLLDRKYLCASATSVPSECAFSIAGHIVNRK